MELLFVKYNFFHNIIKKSLLDLDIFFISGFLFTPILRNNININKFNFTLVKLKNYFHI